LGRDSSCPAGCRPARAKALWGCSRAWGAGERPGQPGVCVGAPGCPVEVQGPQLLLALELVQPPLQNPPPTTHTSHSSF
jgi:hypothetical protein